MNPANFTGTFIRGGLNPAVPPINLPDPNDVTRGTLYCDDRGQIWRAELTPTENRRSIQQWVRVTEVSAEQQRWDWVSFFLFGLAAFVGSVLMFALVSRLGLDALWGTLLVAGTFIICGALSWKALERVSRQVVLPLEAAPEMTDASSVQPGLRDATSASSGMQEPLRSLAIQVSDELWELRMKHGETTRLELGSEGVEGVVEVLHALAVGDAQYATVRATQLVNGVRDALSQDQQEGTS